MNQGEVIDILEENKGEWLSRTQIEKKYNTKIRHRVLMSLRLFELVEHRFNTDMNSYEYKYKEVMKDGK